MNQFRLKIRGKFGQPDWVMDGWFLGLNDDITKDPTTNDICTISYFVILNCDTCKPVYIDGSYIIEMKPIVWAR